MNPYVIQRTATLLEKNDDIAIPETHIKPPNRTTTLVPKRSLTIPPIGDSPRRVPKQSDPTRAEIVEFRVS